MLLQLKERYEESMRSLRRDKYYDDLSYRLRTEYFFEYERLLEEIKTGPRYLAREAVGEVVAEQLHRLDGDLYNLIAYSIMSNHVHILIDTSIQLPIDVDVSNFEDLKCEPLQNIMKRIKGPSAIYANRLLNRSGPFWQRESYDHVIRNAWEFKNISAYILNNPVKAGLVTRWQNHRFTYLSPNVT
jgi:REP element-mobilizing transposase RayT